MFIRGGTVSEIREGNRRKEREEHITRWPEQWIKTTSSKQTGRFKIIKFDAHESVRVIKTSTIPGGRPLPLQPDNDRAI